MTQVFAKDPQAVLDYIFDWSEWLVADTISTSTMTADGLTITNSSHTTTTATVWLSGGSAGTSYAVTNTIVTLGARTEERTITIRVRNL